MKLKISPKLNAQSFLSYFIVIGLMMILIAEPLNMTFFSSLGVWLIFIAVVSITVVTAAEKRQIYVNAITVTTMLFAIMGILSMAICDQISYKSMVALMSVLEIPLFIASIRQISSKRLAMVIYKCFIFASLFFIVISFTSIANRYTNEYGTFQADFLTLGYRNPNQTGMLLFACAAVLLSYFYRVDSIRKKILIALDIAYMLYLIYRTGSRASIIVATLLLLFSFVKKRKIIECFSWACYIVPMCFSLLLGLFYQEIGQMYFLGDVFDTGRLLIYSDVLRHMDLKSFFLGQYSYQFSNLHNLYVSLFATVGLLGTVVLAGLYLSINKKLNMAYETDSARIAYVAICLYMLHASVESAMFLFGSVYAAIIISLYTLCINKEDAYGRQEGW